jgi:dienelactone hydrolase
MLSRLGRQASLLLIVAVHASVCSAEPIASPVATSPALREETWALPLPLPSIAYVIRPAGKGPFPLVIMNHGVATDPRERSFFPLVEFRDAAFWFARRGYLVVAPAGPGYGAGGMDVPERGLYGAFFSKIGKCTNPNFRDAGLAIAKYDLAAIRYLVDQKMAMPDKTIIVGQSAGGWGSIALASLNPPGVDAVIVFAAGRGGRVDGKPNNNCAPDRLVAATAEFGRTAKVPMLWVYTRNDTFFGPDLSTRMHEAFVGAGGNAEYHLLDAFGNDGHFLIGAPKAVEIWSPLVGKFLDQHQ